MKRIPSLSVMDRLTALRASLEHFEESPDFGDSESVAAIRRHLELRIRETEDALRRPPWTKVHIEAA
jgi:hypothetical protein